VEEAHPHDHISGLPGGATSRLAIVLALVTGYMVVEAVAGWLTNSLALLADAGHMLTDAGAIALALFASWLARRPRTARKTYGYHRAEILAALANAVTLVLIVALILWEAYGRLADPPPVMGFEMMLVAMLGLGVNLIGAMLLYSGQAHAHSLNVQGVLWHIVGDALGSVGAVVAGVLMWWRGWYLADPMCSALIAAIILFGAFKLTRASVHVLMEGSPEHIRVDEVQAALEDLPGVRDVHDLHVWTVTNRRESLSVHLTARDYSTSAELLCAARELLQTRFDLEHVTIQIEPPDFVHVKCRF